MLFHPLQLFTDAYRKSQRNKAKGMIIVFFGQIRLITQGWCPYWFSHQNCYRNGQTCWGIPISTCCGMFFVRQSLSTTGVTEAMKLQSWRKSTILKNGQHSSMKGKWIQDISVNNEQSYFTLLFEMGLGYSTINTACSCSTCSVENHPLIYRFMKRVCVFRSTQSRYTSGWNVKVERQNDRTLTSRTVTKKCNFSVSFVGTVDAITA